MKDRFVTYGIILMVFYMGLYIWDQKREIEYLKDGVKEQKEHILKQKKTIEAQNELISVQSEYMILLELERLSPLNKKPHKYYNPI